MIDERLSELLSRYLDDDLDDRDRLDLERRLDRDPKLEAELRDLRQLQRAVVELAASMEPPVELDSVIDPLRRSVAPPPAKIRPVYRWLGAAAALFLGVTVALEVARRNPEPQIQRTAPSRSTFQDDREVFELAPLPTARPDEHPPVLAGDRLLEEQPAAPEPPAPTALEVAGPLPTDDALRESDRPPSQAGKARRPAAHPESTDGTRTGPTTKAQGPGGEAVNEIVTGELAATGDERETRAQAAQTRPAQPAAARSEVVAGATERLSSTGFLPGMLLADGVGLWTGRTTGCGVGVWQVELEVRDGSVVTFEPATEAGEACRAEDLIGTAIGGLTDGRHTVTLEVGQ